MRRRCWRRAENRTKIVGEDFESAVERVVAGPERKSRIISEMEKRNARPSRDRPRACWPNCCPAEPRPQSHDPAAGMALGYTLQFRPKIAIYEPDGAARRHTVFMGRPRGGGACFQEITTGAADDLKKATDLSAAW